MQGEAPGAGYGPHAGNGPHTQQSVPNMPSAPMPAGASVAPPPRRTSRLPVLLSALAIGLAAAALIVSLVRKPESPAAATTPAPATALNQQQLFVEDADRALCQAIAPLMREIGEQNRAFAKLAPGSPEQGAAIPGYRSFIEGWTSRIQEILNSHANPPRYLTRTLQAYIDDKLLYAELAEPGRVDPSDQITWNQASIHAGGPLGTCSNLGITWS
jgi:hypothetical protein